MTSQNTQKQILAMVILMALGIIGLGAYVWFDDGRRPEAEDQQAIEAAERGATLFANNCRVCHGNTGLGRDSDASLVGPALNTPQNTLLWRSGNIGALAPHQRDIFNTIACGRNGTPMPPWAIDEGGSLNFAKIDNLVALITTNAGNAWEVVAEHALELDEQNLVSLEASLRDAQERATAQGIDSAVDSALSSADGDVQAALQAAVLSLLRAEIAKEVARAFADELAAAKDLEDETAIVAVEDAIAVAEAEALASSVRDTLADSGGNEMAALTAVRTTLAQNTLTDAQDKLDLAEQRMAKGLPIAIATPTITKNTCGQRTIETAGGAGGPSADAVTQIDSSGFTADADNGRELFFTNGCNICHGDNGEGNIGPKIAGTQLTFSQVVSQYRDPRANMPPFSADTVPDEDVFDIYNWLLSLDGQ